MSADFVVVADGHSSALRSQLFQDKPMNFTSIPHSFVSPSPSPSLLFPSSLPPPFLPLCNFISTEVQIGAVGISGIAQTMDFPEEVNHSHGMTLGTLLSTLSFLSISSFPLLLTYPLFLYLSSSPLFIFLI